MSEAGGGDAREGRFDLGGSTREFNVPSGVARLAGRISNGILRKTGPGTLFLDSASNAYAGGTRIDISLRA